MDEGIGETGSAGAFGRPVTGLAARMSYGLLVAASVAMFFDGIIRVSTRNFLFSDLFLILSIAILLVERRGRAGFLAEALRGPLTVPVLIFLVSGLLGMTLHATDAGTAPPSTILAVLQLAFVFLLVGPLVSVHSRDAAQSRRLWTVQIGMIALAGTLSLTDALGVTHFTQQPEFWREINPLLGVNGFWLFGMVSASLLMRTIRARGARRLLHGTLWVLGFVGVVLGGVRGGLVLTAGSLMWVGWRFLRDVLRPRISMRALNRLGLASLVLGAAALAAAALLIQLPVFQTRVDMEEVTTVSRRLTAITIALPEIPKYLAAGAGLNQFLNLHPEAGDLIHNYVLQALYETGIPGTIAFLWIFWAAYRNAMRLRRHASGQADLELEDQWNASAFAVVGAFVAGIVYPIGFARFDWLIFLIAVGPRAPRKRFAPQEQSALPADPVSV